MDQSEINDKVPLDDLLKMANEVHSDIKSSIKMVSDIHPKKTDREQVWLTSKEAMELLNVSKRTLERLRSEKQIRYYKVKRRCLYKYKDVIVLVNPPEKC
ncbi:MAG TPA: helix-turn-helix domain-containing protein [Lentimicrobium sp.]|nr:helix-turn-helix domain-containing protein [Lentimicrobium sp.]